MAFLGDKKLEEELGRKVEEALKKKRGYREFKIEDVFERRYYLGPEDLRVVNFYKRTPFSAFNPGALLDGDIIHVFPRLIFDFYVYSSSVGHFSMKVEDFVSGNFERPIETRLILWPTNPWEQRGTEDPRAFKWGGGFGILYTPKGVYLDDGKPVVTDSLALAKMDKDFKLLSKGYFRVVKGDRWGVPSNRDSAVLKIEGAEASIVTRPVIMKRKLCWRAVVNLERLEMYFDTMEVVFAPEEFESHIGWSTNAVKLSSNEYLVGWHGVAKSDQVYRDGVAVVDENGDLLGISNYILSPQPGNPYEEYGDRPGTMFGNGLALYKGTLIWVGGVGDGGIGVFTAELDKVLEKVRWIRG